MPQSKITPSKQESDQQLITVGLLGSPHGIHGWIKLSSYTTPKENIFQYNQWHAKINGRWQHIEITDKKTQGNTILVKLAQCNNPEDARVWTNTKIAINHNLLPKLDNEEYYWKDLTNCTVITTDNLTLGIVDHLIETGSNDVFVVDGETRHMIPYISDVVLNIDIEQKIITVNWDPDL